MQHIFCHIEEESMNKLDDRGKFYTERVRKTCVEVRIVTILGDVHGYVHITPDQRVKDLLNNGSEQFLAVTNATLQVYNSRDRESQQIEFIALNKQHIVSLIPVDEDKIQRQQEEEYYIPR